MLCKQYLKQDMPFMIQILQYNFLHKLKSCLCVCLLFVLVLRFGTCTPGLIFTYTGIVLICEWPGFDSMSLVRLSTSCISHLAGLIQISLEWEFHCWSRICCILRIRCQARLWESCVILVQNTCFWSCIKMFFFLL